MSRSNLSDRIVGRSALAVAWLFVTAVSAASALPLGTVFTFQGRLLDAGSPASGSYDLRFRLFDAGTGGTPVGTTVCMNNVSVANGVFTVPLDFGAVFAGDQRYLEIQVRADTGLGCGNLADFVTLAPRQAIVAAPNALFAANAGQLEGLDSAAFLQSIPLPLSLIGSDDDRVILGLNSSDTDGSVGVEGRSGSSGIGYGVVGVHVTGPGAGVRGEAANSGAGVRGTGGYGVHGSSPSGIGVFGETLGNGYGGRFESPGTGGRGVFGHATATSGAAYGGQFESNSTSGRGIYAVASAASGTTYGAYCQSESTSGRGITGAATALSGTTYGVFGFTNSPSANAYGVWAQGQLGASGTKSFRIDHPEDPENKYLLHYATESPEVINFYRGTATLDGTGGALVELPAHFAKLNRSPSYQLTAVGAPMPNLHVAEEIDAAALSTGAKEGPGAAAPRCSFRIAGGAPGAKVSWRVEAVRNDLWVRGRAMDVEIEKEGSERGRYQHPELYPGLFIALSRLP